MKRVSITPRFNWEEIVESQGLHFHHHDNKKNLYWNESAYYAFTPSQIDYIESATQEIYDMYVQTVQHILDNDLLGKLGIPKSYHNLIRESWDKDDLSIYGRFDFWYDGVNLKLFEFNGDTPTSLFEASVIQWLWMEDVFPNADQFNSIHEALIESWHYIKNTPGYYQPFHLTCVRDHLEDYTTVTYLRDTAQQAGLDTVFLNVDEIGWNSEDNEFRDTEENKIRTIFKLYPWEWMINEDFGKNLLVSDTKFIEPIWKILMSNKGILSIMYELFPECEYLLPTYFEKDNLTSYVKKPIFSREGANIEIVENGVVTHSEGGDYGYEGYVYQDLCKLAGHSDGNKTKYPVIGSWIVGGQSHGMGIRESENLITNNGSCFVPHIIL